MKIAVGLSGGVDSAVSAALLKEEGHEVIAVFMKNWSDDYGLKGDCPWEKDQEDANAVADHLGIKFLTYNFELQYRERVIEYFFSEYKAGRTPNPDILCNSEIKFNVFLKKCLLELNVEKIATGHYARIKTSNSKQQAAKTKNNFEPVEEFKLEAPNFKPRFHLLKGIDPKKDQSYFLCRLNQEELTRTVFPIGEYTKQEVRDLARKFKLPVAEKKDSQGICFVGKINVREFIKSELGSKEGAIIDVDSGKVLGKHTGLWFYTIGQREGLGLGGGPWFVVGKDLGKNIVYVVNGNENPALFQREVILENINILNPDVFNQNLAEIETEVSLRYRQEPSKARAKLQTTKNNLKTQVKIEFSEPQRAVSPGQFGCIYIGDEVIGSGVIT